jgi:hypothetical protein
VNDIAPSVANFLPAVRVSSLSVINPSPWPLKTILSALVLPSSFRFTVPPLPVVKRATYQLAIVRLTVVPLSLVYFFTVGDVSPFLAQAPAKPKIKNASRQADLDRSS